MNNDLIILGQLLLSLFLGSLIGLERQIAQKPAGFRTYALVCLGSTMFTIISETIALKYKGVSGGLSLDPSRLASQIIVGIGFIGAGVIIFHRSKIYGITTAASLWVAAAIGMAIGFKLYSLATIATCLVLIVLIIFYFIEQSLNKRLSTTKSGLPPNKAGFEEPDESI